MSDSSHSDADAFERLGLTKGTQRRFVVVWRRRPFIVTIVATDTGRCAALVWSLERHPVRWQPVDDVDIVAAILSQGVRRPDVVPDPRNLAGLLRLART